MNDAPSTQRACPACGAALNRNSPRGLCVRCLVSRSLSLRPSAPDGPFTLPSVEDLNALFADFEVRGLLGRGGMGAVYEAWQKSLARPVALKILPPELTGDSEFLERFQREARSMAQLDQPGVAKVFETGFTDAGEPFIVMELIPGEPITRFATSQELGLRARIDLFLQVCGAVQHAHQKGILHRDIKPSNVLVGIVDGRARAKMIDFGLAKPLADTRADAFGWRSHASAAGTPAYMSPEQAAGGDVDTRSDVYSLGALLYELLTDTPPIETTGVEHDPAKAEDRPRNFVGASCPHYSVIAEAVQNTPIVRPSEQAGQPPGHAALRGDLDAILLKALARNPDDRYPTVAALADDLERHLRHEPVIAVPPTAGYRFRKFLRRHRVGVAAALGLSALLAIGITLILRESVSTRRAEQLAESRLRQGERLIEFMLGDLHAKLDQVGRLDILEAAISATEKYYGDPSAATTPESLRNRAQARLALGRVRNAQGQIDAARANYDEAIRLHGAALAAQPNHRAGQEALAQAWNSLAVLHHSAHDVPSAEHAYQQALELNDQMRAADADNPVWIDSRASFLHNLAALYDLAGRIQDSERTYGEAMKLWEPLLTRRPEDPELLEHLAELHQSVAFVRGKREGFDEALQSNLEALRFRERLVALDPKNLNAQSQLANTQQNIAEAYLRQPNLDLAEEWMRRYRPIRERLAAADPGNAVWAQLLADACRNHALLLVGRGNDEAAVVEHRRAWEISEKLLARPNSRNDCRPSWIDGLRAAEEILQRLVGRAESGGKVEAARNYGETLAEIRGKLDRAVAETATDQSGRRGSDRPTDSR